MSNKSRGRVYVTRVLMGAPLSEGQRVAPNMSISGKGTDGRKTFNAHRVVFSSGSICLIVVTCNIQYSTT